jgi:hypothetical protein
MGHGGAPLRRHGDPMWGAVHDLLANSTDRRKQFMKGAEVMGTAPWAARLARSIAPSISSSGAPH